MIAPTMNLREHPLPAVLTESGRIRILGMAALFGLLGGLIVAMALGLAIGTGDAMLLLVLIPHAMVTTVIFSALMACLLFFDSDEPVHGATVLKDESGGMPIDLRLAPSQDLDMERRRRDWTAWCYDGRRNADRPGVPPSQAA